MSILEKFGSKLAMRTVVTAVIVAAGFGVTTVPAWADTIIVAAGNSPKDAADRGRVECYATTDYKSTEVLSGWRYVDENGATMFKARVRCY